MFTSTRILLFQTKQTFILFTKYKVFKFTSSTCHYLCMFRKKISTSANSWYFHILSYFCNFFLLPTYLTILALKQLAYYNKVLKIKNSKNKVYPLILIKM